MIQNRIELRAEVRRRDGKRCHYCPRRGTTLDHVVPEYRGGPTVLTNLVLACSSCNSDKGHQSTSCDCAFCLAAVLSFPEIEPQLHPKRLRRQTPGPLGKTRVRKTGSHTWSVVHAEGYTVPCSTWHAAIAEALAGIDYTNRRGRVPPIEDHSALEIHSALE